MNPVIRFLLFALLSTVASSAASAGRVYGIDDVPHVQKADSTRFVSDPENILDAADRAALDNMLRSLRRATTVEGAVVVVPDVAGDPGEFATALFEKWGFGKQDRDNGLLVLVATERPNITIRPGYGTEGVLPDGLLGRIKNEKILPHFRRGEYGPGLVAGLSAMNEVMLRPDNAEYLRSHEEKGSLDWADIFLWYFAFSLLLAVVMCAAVASKTHATRGLDGPVRYAALVPLRPMLKGLSWVCLGMPLIPYFWVKNKLAQWRDSPRNCPNCRAVMEKLDEEADNAYLTPAQDLEERINSVDYDVWVCPSCNETDIFPFPQRDTPFVECPACHARTARPGCRRIVCPPTETRKGRGVQQYTCLNCRRNTDIPYDIPATGPKVPPVVFIPGIGGGLGGSRGPGGGGFGGGHTGGGGVSSGW